MPFQPHLCLNQRGTMGNKGQHYALSERACMHFYLIPIEINNDKDVKIWKSLTLVLKSLGQEFRSPSGSHYVLMECDWKRKGAETLWLNQINCTQFSCSLTLIKQSLVHTDGTFWGIVIGASKSGLFLGAIIVSQGNWVKRWENIFL